MLQPAPQSPRMGSRRDPYRCLVFFWKGLQRLPPPSHPPRRYIAKVDAAMQALKRRVDGAPITVLTHSAGGWLGRTYLHDFGVEGVDRFVSLGSPHLPPPAGVIDQTRGILTHCEQTFPGAFYPSVKYVTIAGKFVRGVKLGGEGTALAKFAGAGYEQVRERDVFLYYDPISCM